MVMEQLIDNLVDATIQNATLQEKERCFHLVIDVIKKNMIVWPTVEDSITWNTRIDKLIDQMIDAFDVSGENK